MHSSLSPVIIVPVLLVGGVLVQTLISRNYDYQCGNCGHRFSPSAVGAAIAPHRFGGMKLLRCPSCGKITWAQAVPKQ